MKQRILRLLLFLSCVAALQACATQLRYSAEPIEARVIDADTNQPLAGVIVVAHWSLRADGIYPGGSPYAGELMVMETVTDKEGRFALPGWGPKFAFGTFLEREAPELILFKSDYHYERLLNRALTDFDVSVRRSEWSGKTIKMKQFVDYRIQEGPTVTSAYARHLAFIKSSLNWAYRDWCDLKKAPRIVVALHLQAMRFKERGIYSSLPTIDHVFDDKYGDPCNARKTLERYMP